MGKRRSSLLSAPHLQNAYVVNKGKRVDKAIEKPTQLELFSDVIRTEDYITLPAMKFLIGKFEQLGNEMTLEQFKEQMAENVMKRGPDFDRRMDILFRKMDTNNNGLVELDEFCSHFMADLEEKHNLHNEREVPLMVCPHLFENPHRAQIIRVEYLDHPSRFVVYSEEGVVSFWTMKMAVHRVVSLIQPKSIRSAVFTYAVSIPNAFRVALTSSNRDICFYETTTGTLCNRIVSLPDSVSYLYYTLTSTTTGVLIWGDLSGSIHRIEFLQTSKSLFPTHNAPFQDPLNIQYKILKSCDKKLLKLSKYSPHKPIEDEVDRSVKKIQHYEGSDFIVSCAGLQESAVVIYSISRDDYQSITIPKGAFTFDYSRDLNMIVTGGNDCKVRLWNPYVPSNALSVLSGHAAPVIHVVFNSGYGQAISLSQNEHIKIWDVNEYVCLNTIAAVIPHHSAHGQFTVRNMLWHESTQCMLTTTNTELCVIELSHHDDSSATLTTHTDAVTCMLPLPSYGHIITACANGDIKLWDLATGELLLQVSSAHGPAAITSLVAINSNSILVSSASDGTVKTWNIFSGVVQQTIEMQGMKEILSSCKTPENVFIVGSGGNIRGLRRGGDKKASELKPDPLWHPQGAHEGDITSIDFCPVSLLATGSADGYVRIWNINLMKSVALFNPKEKLAKTVPSGNRATGVQSLLRHASNTVVDKVMWLQSRVAVGIGRRNDCATLVTSGQGGMCMFWNPFKGTLMGWFTAAHSKVGREKVLAMCTGENDTVLVTGDSQGFVYLWDIARYCCGKKTATKSGDESPRVISTWRAHVNVISDVQLVFNSTIVTSSSDCSVRVWSLNGDYIGTFGEGTDSSWVLSANNSLSLTEAVEKFDNDSQRKSVQLENVEGIDLNNLTMSPKPSRRINKANKSGGLEPLAEGWDESDHEVRSNDDQPLQTHKQKMEQKISKLKKKEGDEISKEEEEEEKEETSEAIEDVVLPKNILGNQVRSHMQLRTLAKRDVRKTKSEMNFSKTVHEGFQFCSPFQALEPSDLSPVTSRVREPTAVARQRRRKRENIV
eukprot:m.127299 g.127299  ORF g.127299 m.127299 type:complete len:1057 (+) comp13005_c0_seq2:75-3245(+)